MPNWCATNYLLRGPKDKIQDFCDKVNSCIDQPDVQPNNFGKFWLGNIYAAFENRTDNMDTVHGLRGCLDPEPDSVACLFGPYENVQKLIPTIDTSAKEKEWMRIAFSTQTAWDMSDWFNDMLEEKYPEIEVSFKATDEFGNFHVCHNPERLGIRRFEIWHHDHTEYNLDTAEETADLIRNITGLNFTKEDIEKESAEFRHQIDKYNENHEGEELEITIWKTI